MEQKKSNSSQNYGLIIFKWIVSIVFLFAALGFVGNKAYTTAIIITLLLVLILPPISIWLKVKLPFLNRGLKMGLVILLLTLAGVCLPDGYLEKVKNESIARHIADSIAKQKESLNAKKPDIDHTALFAANSKDNAESIKVKTPQYTIEKELQIRYDGGKSYFILIDEVDLSSPKFIEDIKLIVNEVVSSKGSKINIEIFDSKESLDLSYSSNYGTNSLGRALTKKERKLLERHSIAGFAGELNTMAYPNTLMIFPSAFKYSPEVGKYCLSLEYNP